MSCSVVEATSEPPKVVRTPSVLNMFTSKCPSRHNGVHFFDIRTSKSGPNPWCFVHFDFEMCFAPQRRALFQHLNCQKWSGAGVFFTFWLGKCASRHNGVHFFDISTSKSGPRMVCFVHFHLEMCFAPQRRALFRHLNFQKWSENGVFCTFTLGNVLRATTACTFFDISTSKSGPRMVCFVHFHFEMCFAPQRCAIFHLSSGQLAPHPPALASLLFDPPEPQIIGKTQCFATFPPFRASASSFFWLFLFWSSLF